MLFLFASNGVMLRNVCDLSCLGHMGMAYVMVLHQIKAETRAIADIFFEGAFAACLIPCCSFPDFFFLLLVNGSQCSMVSVPSFVCVLCSCDFSKLFLINKECVLVALCNLFRI